MWSVVVVSCASGVNARTTKRLGVGLLSCRLYYSILSRLQRASKLGCVSRPGTGSVRWDGHSV